jgi:uridine phosphorylase
MTKTWTTDGIYRETPARIRKRRKEGCTTVEMEGAALFAVAAHRGVDIGMILYAGDDVGGNTWQTRGWRKQSGLRQQLIHLAAKACLEII